MTKNRAKMSEIILKIDKGNSHLHDEIMELAKVFSNIRECKRHYCIHIPEDEIFQYQKELFRAIQLLSRLREKSWFNIPAYGTDEWANWMIDLHLQRKSKSRKGRPKKAPNF